MPKVTAQGETIECDRGANLRQVLLKANDDSINLRQDEEGECRWNRELTSIL